MKVRLTVFFFLLLSSASFAQDSPELYRSRYSSAVQSGQFESAIAIAEDWKRDEPKKVIPYYLAAKALSKKGRKNAAMKNLREALTIDSLHVPSLLAYAELSNSESLEYFEKLIAINPSNSYFYRKAAENAIEYQKFDKALAYYNLAYRLDSLDIVTINGFARLLMDFRQQADADTLLERALRLDPSNEFARLTKAKIAFDSEKWEEVLNWCEPYFDSTPPLTVMRFVGISLYQLGEYAEAIEWLRKLSNTATKLDYPHYYMGLCMEKLDQTEMATVQYGQALNKALSANLGPYYERLGLMQQAEGNHKEAIESFQMASKFSASNILNFHLAKSYDVYYQDSKMASDSFKEFLRREEIDETAETAEMKYARARVNQIKKQNHFEGN